MLISIGTFICASWNEFSYPDIKNNGNVNAVESFYRFTCRSLICVVFDDRFTCTFIALKTQKGIAQLPFGNFPFQCHKNQYLELRHKKATWICAIAEQIYIGKAIWLLIIAPFPEIFHWIFRSRMYIGREGARKMVRAVVSVINNSWTLSNYPINVSAHGTCDMTWVTEKLVKNLSRMWMHTSIFSVWSFKCKNSFIW